MSTPAPRPYSTSSTKSTTSPNHLKQPTSQPEALKGGLWLSLTFSFLNLIDFRGSAFIYFQVCLSNYWLLTIVTYHLDQISIYICRHADWATGAKYGRVNWN